MKQGVRLLLIMSMFLLVGCGKKEQPIVEEVQKEEIVQTKEDIKEEPIQETTQKFHDVLNNPKEEPTPTPKKKDTTKGYYEQLLENKNEQDEQNAITLKEDMELANILLGVCTDKLVNSTFVMTTSSTLKDISNTQLDIVKEAKEKGKIITETEWLAYTEGYFDERNTCLITTCISDYYSDNESYGSEIVLDYISINSTSDWNDNVDTFMFESNSNGNGGYYINNMTTGEAARFWPKDVQSCLSPLLQLNIKSIEKDIENNLYIIKGTTKEKINLVRETGPFSILNRDEWVMADKETEDKVTREKGYFNLSEYATKKLDVTCYITIDTETLVALKTKNETEKELTETHVLISDVGSTDASRDNSMYMNTIEKFNQGQTEINNNKIFED